MFVTSISIRLFTAVKNKNAKHPVVLQVLYRNPNNQKTQVRRKRTGFFASKAQWDVSRFKTSAKRGKEYNQRLDQLEEKAWEIAYKCFSSRPFNYILFSSLLESSDKSIELRELYEEVSKELYLQDRVGTAMSYKSAVISAYKFNRKAKMLLSEIDEKWLREYVEWNLKKGNKCNVYLRSLKALFGKAVDRGYLELADMPFKTKYKPRGYCFIHLNKLNSKNKATKRIKTLSIEQMKMVLKYEPKTEAQEKALDYFLFSYYNMGVDLKDIALLKTSDIKNDLWFHRRQKSRIEVMGKPLTNKSLELINKYYKSGNKFLFNDLLGNKYCQSEVQIKARVRDISSNLTRRYKLIAKDLGLDGYFTINTARHTSATICKQQGGDINAISKLLNHSNIKTTNIYVGNSHYEQMKTALHILILER